MMKRFIVITLVLTSLTLSSCKKEHVSFYYPNSSIYGDLSQGFTYDFDSIESVRQLQDSLWNFHRNHSERFPVFFIQQEDQGYYFAPFYNSEDLPPITKFRNELGVSKDSVWKNEELFSINRLNDLLKKDLFNFGKDSLFSETPEKMRVTFLHLETKSISELKESLLTIFQVYNQLDKNDAIRLNISLRETFIPKAVPLE